jgi:hypothetical protein
MFRNKVAIALQARSNVMKSLSNFIGMQKVRKHLFCHILSSRIVASAFKKARDRIDGSAAW